MKNGLQKFGKFLSAMVMPNIGAFIAWGFITAFFIADGWIPNAKLASIQPYMLTFLLPMLIAYTGGKQVGGDRGGVLHRRGPQEGREGAAEGQEREDQRLYQGRRYQSHQERRL